MASNNLLYNGYKTGHAIYVNTGTNELAEFNCAESADCAMYFADLEPNTTYTLSNVDNSDRFRWGLTSIDIKNLSNTATTEQPSTIWTQGFVSEGSYVVGPITFTTGEDDIHLGVYYTNSGAYDRRVMLNKGDTILPYEEPDLIPPWIKFHISDSYPYIHYLPEPMDVPDTEHLPYSILYIDDSYPYSPHINPIIDVNEPYPTSIMTIPNDNSEYPRLSQLPEPLQTSSPYPASVMILPTDNSIYPKLEQLNIINIGACCHVPTLTEVVIPKSCKSIGEHAFTGTNLNSVSIPSTCNISSTSFPETCIITYQPD